MFKDKKADNKKNQNDMMQKLTFDNISSILSKIGLIDRPFSNGQKVCVEFPNIDSEIKIFTSLIHKEDTMFLCGFLQKETRDIFKILTSVSGVGTKMALALLGKFDACNLISIVINENYKELTLAKGVGTKLAQKIILELRDKLIKANIAPAKPDDPLIETQASKDTFSVLQSLGYEYDEIKSSIAVASSRLSNPNDSEELLRECLKHLSM